MARRKKKNIIDKMERKFGKYAISNLTKYYVILNTLGCILAYIGYFSGIDIYRTLFSLDLRAIMHGQVWRIFTYILDPYTLTSAMSIGSMFLGVLIMLINIWFILSIGRSLEESMGTFRYNVYFFSGMLLIVIARLSCHAIIGADLFEKLCTACNLEPTMVLELMIVFAFATVNGDRMILFFGIIPLKIRWFAYILAGMQLVNLVQLYNSVGLFFISIIFISLLVSLTNYFIFFINYKKNGTSNSFVRKKSSNKQKIILNVGKKERHKCCVCGKTEKDDPTLEFRFCSRCEGNHEYCMEHLFTHEHVKKIVIDINKNKDNDAKGMVVNFNKDDDDN